MVKKVLFLMAISLLFVQSAFAKDFKPANVLSVAGDGGLSYQDGKALEASFAFPSYAVEGRDGSIYISDTQNHRIRKLSSDGKVTTYAGKTTEVDQYGLAVGGYVDGEAEDAMFASPKGLALDDEGQLYVVDSGNNAIRSISPAGEVATVIDGLNTPTDIVIDQEGNLIVSDTMNHRIVKITNGKLSVLTGSGYEQNEEERIGAFKDGSLSVAQFNEPTGLAISENGTIYVADSGNQKIRKIQNGQVSTIAGASTEKLEGTPYLQGDYVDGSLQTAEFNFPQGLAVGENGTVYVADTYNYVIRAIHDGNVMTVAGNGESGINNSVEFLSSFGGPTDVVVLKNGNLLVVDKLNNQIRMIDWYELPPRINNEEALRVVVNQKKVNFDVQPMIKQGRTVLPVRQLSEALGYSLNLNEKEGIIQLKLGNREIVLQVGTKTVKVGEQEIEIDLAPYIESGRTMVPVRFVVQAFDKNVTWVASDQTVLIRD